MCEHLSLSTVHCVNTYMSVLTSTRRLCGATSLLVPSKGAACVRTGCRRSMDEAVQTAQQESNSSPPKHGAPDAVSAHATRDSQVSALIGLDALTKRVRHLRG